MSRSVLITGGGRGLGAELSRTFHAAGYRVAIVSRRDSGLAGELGERALHVSCDVTRRDEIRAMVAAVIAWAGTIDVLVNNAGRSDWRPLADIDDAFWTDMLAVNLSSVLLTSQAVLPHLGAGASIVNISSLAGKRGSANNAAYCAAKFGVNGLTQSLAKELGPVGIRVNAVCPVYIETDGLITALDSPQSPAGGGNIRAYLDDFARSQAALRRLPQGEQVAAACLFLASDAAAAITGQCINVDCGVLPS